MNKPVSTIMTTKVCTVGPKDKLSLIKKYIFERKFHHIPVVEEGRLVGIVTSIDLMKLDMKFAEYENIPVENVMTKKVVTLEPDSKIGTAVQIFMRHLFHGIPIVDDNNILVGIITTHDVLKSEHDRMYPDDDVERAFRQRRQV